MKKTHILIIVGLTAFLSVGGTVLFMKKNNEIENAASELNSSQIIEEDGEKEFVSTVDVRYGWETIPFSKRIDEWTSKEEPFVGNLVEEVIQQMAHQKIIADEKEGSIMITPERIEILLQMVEENKDEYEHHEIYLDILKRWNEGDFSSVDYDHNVLMYIQRSKYVSGVAKGIASKEQEINYIFRVFAKEVDEVFGSTEKSKEKK